MFELTRECYAKEIEKYFSTEQFQEDDFQKTKEIIIIAVGCLVNKHRELPGMSFDNYQDLRIANRGRGMMIDGEPFVFVLRDLEKLELKKAS